MEKIIIGLAGRLASGKGRVSKELIEKHGAFRVRSSDPLRATLDMFGVPQSRDNLSALSTFLRTTFGEGTINYYMEKVIAESHEPIALFDGMRIKAQLDHFRKFPNFRLVFIDARQETRYQRYITRNENPGDAEMSYADFLKRDNLEPEQQIESLRQFADFVIDNNGTQEQLDAQIETVLKNLISA